MSCIHSDLLIAINRLTISFIFVVIKPQYYAQPTPIVSTLFSHRFFGCVENEIERYDVLISVEPHGSASISPEVYGPLFPGDSLSITITPADGFSFDHGAERSTLLKKPSPFLVRKTTNSMQRSALCLTCQKSCYYRCSSLAFCHAKS